MYTLGADVSHWEGTIDWTTASQWLPFAYFKCTEGTNYFDPKFLHNKKGCLDAGIPHSPYHWFKPHVDPIAQAEFFYSAAGGDYLRYIVDVEEPPTGPKAYNYQDNLLKFVNRFKVISKRDVAIYTSPGFWDEWLLKPKHPTWAENLDLIVANYSIARQPILPRSFGRWKIWQFSKFFYFPGCFEIADGNWFNGDLHTCREWFGNYHDVGQPVYNLTRFRSLHSGLNIRQAPSTESRSVGKLVKGEIVEAQNAGGNDVWIKHERGWSCVEKDDYRYMEALK